MAMEPSPTTTTPPLATWRRFSIRFLFMLIALSAAGMGVWKAFIYEPPTHKIPAYEKAPVSRGLVAQVGPNTIRIQSVARNRRDGGLVVESGKGERLTSTVPGASLLRSSALWLDVAQIELRPGPDRLEIIEARIFDHATRTLVAQVDPAFGWQVVKPNLLQVYGLGKNLPPSLDVWLRVHSYGDNEQALSMPLVSGSKAFVPGGSIALRAVQSGFEGWNSRTGFYPLRERHVGETAVVLACDGWGSALYQVAAVSVHGDKYFSGRYLHVGARGERQQLLLFPYRLDEIDHLEIRPHGGRHRFFFEAVVLPAATGMPFGPPPTATLPVTGAGAQAVLTEFAPLRVRLDVKPGAWAVGSTASTEKVQILTLPEPEDAGTAFTLTCEVRGLSPLPPIFRFRDAATGAFLSDSAFGTRSRHQAAALVWQITAGIYSTPISAIDAIEVAFGESR